VCWRGRESGCLGRRSRGGRVRRGAPVYKGADAFAKIDQAALEDLPDLYHKSPSAARAEAAKRKPARLDAYHREHGAR
jgi:hypothetical protein